MCSSRGPSGPACARPRSQRPGQQGEGPGEGSPGPRWAEASPGGVLAASTQRPAPGPEQRAPGAPSCAPAGTASGLGTRSPRPLLAPLSGKPCSSPPGTCQGPARGSRERGAQREVSQGWPPHSLPGPRGHRSQPDPAAPAPAVGRGTPRTRPPGSTARGRAGGGGRGPGSWRRVAPLPGRGPGPPAPDGIWDTGGGCRGTRPGPGSAGPAGSARREFAVGRGPGPRSWLGLNFPICRREARAGRVPRTPGAAGPAAAVWGSRSRPAAWKRPRDHGAARARRGGRPRACGRELGPDPGPE